MLSARAGAHTLLLTQNLETIGQMSCNPAIGGIAKGTVVREVDALGGVMGRATDHSRVQFRMLNRSKGPAVWSPRAQCDRALYRRAVRALLERQPRLSFGQGTVASFLLRGGRVAGVVTREGLTLEASAVVLSAGTFSGAPFTWALRRRFQRAELGKRRPSRFRKPLVHMGLYENDSRQVRRRGSMAGRWISRAWLVRTEMWVPIGSVISSAPRTRHSFRAT